LSLNLGQAKPKISGTAPTNRHTPIPNESGTISACLEGDAKLVNCEIRVFGSPSKHADIGSESFGIEVFRFVGTVPDILGLVWRNFRLKSGSESPDP
jgi:hypothetical protein